LSGAITLAQVAAKIAMLDIACSKFERAGRRNVQSLIAEYGVKIGQRVKCREPV